MTIISAAHPHEENFIQTLSLLIISFVLIFYSDITTPLGLMTWILYFIPLFLTLYLKWQYGPFVVSGSAIILIGISYFLSPRDMSETYAILNRIFFSLMLLASSFLLWRYKKWELVIEVNEERYQHMVESSPDMILIVKDEVIQYCNPTGIEHYGLNAGENYSNLFEPEFLTTLSSYIEKAAYGAKFELSEITVIGKDSKKILTDMWVGEIIWDGVPAVELIIRTKNH